MNAKTRETSTDNGHRDLFLDMVNVLRAVAEHFKDTDAPLGSAARDCVRRFDDAFSADAGAKP